MRELTDSELQEISGGGWLEFVGAIIIGGVGGGVTGLIAGPGGFAVGFLHGALHAGALEIAFENAHRLDETINGH
jgi:bacteriocin-like protein